jgi:hypothetical protein
MFKFLPLAVAIALTAPASALTVVKVDYRPGVASRASEPRAAPTKPSNELLPGSFPEDANWAFLVGGVALIAAMRLGRRQPLVSN